MYQKPFFSSIYRRIKPVSPEGWFYFLLPYIVKKISGSFISPGVWLQAYAFLEFLFSGCVVLKFKVKVTQKVQGVFFNFFIFIKFGKLCSNRCFTF
jgi:hypothetical protein